MHHTYNNNGRRTETYQKIDTEAEVKLSSMVYNEIGQLWDKAVQNELYRTAYAYNSVGWLNSRS